MEEKNIKNKFSSFLDLPKEIVLNYPLVSLVGNEDLIIYNHKGLIEYTNDTIRINTTCGILKIEGKGMYIVKITNEYVKLSGKIKSVIYI